MYFAYEKPQLLINLWHDFNDKKPELALIFGICFFADEKLELSTNLWHDFNDKKPELSIFF